MSIANIWMDGDLIIKILIIALVLVLIMALEKMYQYFQTYRTMKQLEKLDTLEEVETLKDSFIKNTLLEIKNFQASSNTLLNAFVGVKLDMYEYYIMRYVTTIGVIAILSPMLGLIGTFTGVLHVFEGIGSIGLNDPAVIARGIKEVLVDTMAGLIVAVIAMIFYKSFEYVSAKNISKYEEKIYMLLRGKNA